MDVNENKKMPALEQVANAIKQHKVFNHFIRYPYLRNYNIDEALKIVETIGKSRDQRFVIDDENRFTYENLIKWCHCDTSMKCIEPNTRAEVQGRLKSGIYIAGNTGSGKSWCLEIMRAYCQLFGFKILFTESDEQRLLFWKEVRADEICEAYARNGDIQLLKKQKMLGIQDLGSEPSEILYMGNRLDVVRNLIEYRGDSKDTITLITSNLRINGEILINRYGDRVSSRLIEMCNYFELKGKDRRTV